MKRILRSRALPPVLLVAAILAVLFTLQLLPLLEWITALQEWMGSKGAAGAVLYALVYAACNLLLLPGGLLGIGSGFFFGLWWGFVIVTAGNLLAAAAAFLISRFCARRWIERKIVASPRWAALDASIQREGWKVVVLSQAHPLFPTSLLQYVYGATGIAFWHCLGWVALGQAPGRFLYCYLGTLGQHGLSLAQGQSSPHPYEYALWIGGLILSVAVTALLGRLALRMLRDFREAR